MEMATKHKRKLPTKNRWAIFVFTSVSIMTRV